MYKILFINILFIMSNAWPNVEISLSPQKPVKNESFNVVFTIQMENEHEPEIKFNPIGLDILGKSNTGVSTRTTYMNGKLTVEKKMTITYEMLASNPGIKYINNIEVIFPNKTIKPKSLRIIVLNRSERPKEVFALAVADKEEVFEGESILIRYYLYNSIQVMNTEIRKFPKLDKYLKRYHQEKMNPERVKYNNKIYTRRVLYTAQLFAEKAGEYKIDPITLSVGYSTGGNTFGGIGFGFGRSKRKNLTSQVIKIKVKSLPVENVPPHFTGLVGKHNFELKLNKSKFITNEPIELNLTVTGMGALELFEAPKLIKSNAIEEFESNADLKINKDFTAKKIFKYTYLGRENTSLKSARIPLSYFNPETLKFETQYLDLPEIIIAGAKSNYKVKSDNENTNNKITENPTIQPVKKEFGFILKPISTYIYHASSILYCLLVLILIYLAWLAYLLFINSKNKELPLLKEIEIKGLSYQGSLDLAYLLTQEKCTLSEAVESIDIKDDSKSYFKDISTKLNENYKKAGKFATSKINKKHLKSIRNYIKSKNEDKFLSKF